MHKNKAENKVSSRKSTPQGGDAAVIALKMMQSLPDAIVAFDSQRKIIFANDAARLFFRMPLQAIDDIVGTANVVAEFSLAVMRDGKTLTLHDVTIHGHQADRISFCPLEGGDTWLMSISASALNLNTEWASKMRSAIKPAELMARTLAHEVKNPLAGIRAAAQLLEKLDLSDDDRELVALIGRETDRILRLMQKVDVLGGDAKPKNFKKVNLHEVLGHVNKVAKAAFGPGVVIEEKYDPSLPQLEGDFDRLIQAQFNLVKNAAEALPDQKGKISVRTFYDNAAGYHPESRVRLPVCIEIEDNGAGIDPDTLRRIFEPFFTTKPGGEGLGLSVVSKIVDEHGGLIDVKSGPGKTVVRLSFPLGMKKPKNKFQPEPSHDPA